MFLLIKTKHFSNNFTQKTVISGEVISVRITFFTNSFQQVELSFDLNWQNYGLRTAYSSICLENSRKSSHIINDANFAPFYLLFLFLFCPIMQSQSQRLASTSRDDVLFNGLLYLESIVPYFPLHFFFIETYFLLVTNCLLAFTERAD